MASVLSRNPSSPIDLREALDELFGEHRELASRISDQLEATVNTAAPDRKQLLAWAEHDGLATDRLEMVQRALDAPRHEHVRRLRERWRRLDQSRVRPVPPPALKELSSDSPSPHKSAEPAQSGRKPVKTIKVGEGHDRRKRKLGEEGEQWALAAVVSNLMQLDEEARDLAIADIVALLGLFEGPPVDEALSHAARVRMNDLDEEERVEELSGLLHVSSYSDAFGFDLIGWFPQGQNSKGGAVCLEVKSSGGEGFHLSRNEWSVAERLHTEEAGDQYAVLVVRRSKGGGVPAAMDLLSDPVALVDAGLLRSEVDGYQLVYRTKGF